MPYFGCTRKLLVFFHFLMVWDTRQMIIVVFKGVKYIPIFPSTHQSLCFIAVIILCMRSPVVAQITSYYSSADYIPIYIIFWKYGFLQQHSLFLWLPWKFPIFDFGLGSIRYGDLCVARRLARRPEARITSEFTGLSLCVPRFLTVHPSAVRIEYSDSHHE